MNGPVSLRRYIGCEGPSGVGAGSLWNLMAVPPGVQSNPSLGAAACPDVPSCSVPPLRQLARLAEATGALAQGIGREQLSETQKKAACGCHRRRGTAGGMGGAAEGLRTRRDMVNKPGSPFQAQWGCRELGLSLIHI